MATGVFEAFRTLVRIPALLVAYGAAVTILMSFVTMFFGLNEFAVKQLHLSPERILWLRLISMTGVVSALFCGSWIRRFGPVRVLVAGFLTAAAGLAGEAALSGVNMALFIAATVVFVAGIAAAVPAIISRIGLLGLAARGMALALYGFFVFVRKSGPNPGRCADALRIRGFMRDAVRHHVYGSGRFGVERQTVRG
ncbi:MFS transporter [Paenibacillus zanthoxyli]|uniref:hypothetical protein n=1 Tax=Paenibacillus zanthoxyli TaxID=369399 RepID=UPI00046E7443|nr:hypothetical protein [Paenibacillus zanthoxyli]